MTKVQIVYNKNPSQEELHRDISTPMPMFCAGWGGGKTYALCMKMLQLSALNKEAAGGLLCPSYAEYKKDILPTFIEILTDNNLLGYTKINQTDKSFVFPWTKKPLYIFTAEKPIKGPNLGYAGFNEFSMMQYERIQEMIARVRVKEAPYPQKVFCGTPEDMYGWLEDFVEAHQESGMLRLIKGKTTDNPYLDPSYVDHLRATLDEKQFKLFAEGEMIKLGANLFYYAFSREKNITDKILDPLYPIYINLDFNVGNMNANVSQIYKQDGKKISHFVDEIVLKDFSSDTHEMVRAIKNRYPDMEDQILITCDFSGGARKTTGPSDVSLLRQAGYEVRYRAKGNMRLRKRQILVNGLLHNRLLLINRAKCPTLFKDLLKVMQKEDFTKDKTNPDLTHASDSLDYFVDFEYEITPRQRFNIGKAR